MSRPTPAEVLAQYLIDNGYGVEHGVQLFGWMEGDDPLRKVIVVKQNGGSYANVTRDVACSIAVVWDVGGNRIEAANKANEIFELLRVATFSSDSSVFSFQPDEPVFFNTTNDRPYFEMNVRVLAD